ncbi:MAG: hypothetical protein ABIR92_00525 [Gemmatimonadaceae bacterium]
MRSMKCVLLLASAIACATASAAMAQAARPPVARDTNITHVLLLMDGSTLVGKLISRDSAVIHFETNGGTLTLPIGRVKELRAIDSTDVRGDEYWFPDANETRLFFAPTGRMLKKGEGYYSNTYILLQNFVGAPSDRFTFGGGFSIVPSDDFLQDNLYYITPKLGIYNTPKTNVAAGVLVGVLPGSGTSGSESFGILYAVGTRGGPDASVTGGIGYGFANGDLQSRPVFMLGGAKRVSRRVSLVTENYGFWTRDQVSISCVTYPCTYRERNDFHGLISYGIRFMGEKISTDLALWNSPEQFRFPGVPYLGFAVKF